MISLRKMNVWFFRVLDGSGDRANGAPGTLKMMRMVHVRLSWWLLTLLTVDMLLQREGEVDLSS